MGDLISVEDLMPSSYSFRLDFKGAYGTFSGDVTIDSVYRVYRAILHSVNISSTINLD